MENSDFWRDLAEKFRAVPDPDGLLCAYWIREKSGPYQWSIVPTRTVGGTRSARVRFEALAARGGAKVENPNERSLLDAWLDALNKETPNDTFGSGAETVDGKPSHICGSIRRICEMSAVFCNILESRSLEAERITREDAQGNDSSIQDPSTPKSALSELRDLGLAIDINEITATKIKAELLIIDGRLRQGLYPRLADGDSQRGHLYDVYHAVAKQIVFADTADDVLENIIPAVVQAFSTKQKWLPYLNLDMLRRYFIQGPIAEWKGKRLLMSIDNPIMPKVLETAPQVPSHQVDKPETIGSQLDRLREECRLTIEQLAHEVDVNPRSVQRHLADDSIPYGRHLRAYERVFSKLLNCKVVISKMP